MDQKKIINFLEFYLEAELEGWGEEEDAGAISRELEEAGINAERSEGDVLELIANAKIEAKKERGKKFKEEFYELLKGIKSNSKQVENELPELSVAFRKLEKLSNFDDVLDDEDKLKLLEYLRKKKDS